MGKTGYKRIWMDVNNKHEFTGSENLQEHM